jgi:Ca2+-binding RTX toxin-like protein
MPTITGTPGPDILNGTAGADSISGGEGNDQLFGRGGADTLTGGNGSDAFIIGAGESPTSAATLGHPENLVHITDWSSTDRLVFSGEAAGSFTNLVGIHVADIDAAISQATGLFAFRPGTVFVVATIGPDVVVIDDQLQAVVLSNRAFSDINPLNIVSNAAGPLPGVEAAIGGNLDLVQLQHLIGTTIVDATSTSLVLQGAGVNLTLTGTGFTYDFAEQLNGGTVTNIVFTDPEPGSAHGSVFGHIDGLSLPATTLVGYLELNANSLAFSTIFSGSDSIGGSLGGADLIRGYDGDDVIQSQDGGPDTIFGGNGNDSIVAGNGSDFLNGGPGMDTMTGGAGANVFEFGAGESPSALAAGGHLEKLDHITDWTSSDFVQFTGGVVAIPGSYIEITASSFDQAAATAQSNFVLGFDYTVAQVGSDLVVFGLKEADAVVLSNHSLADISLLNVGGNPALAGATPPPTGATVDLFDGSDMGTFQESFLVGATATFSPTLEHLTFGGGSAQMYITGVGLTYDAGGIIRGGTVTGVEITSSTGHFVLAGGHTDGSVLGQAFETNDANLSISTLLSGDDVITARGSAPGTDTTFTGLGFGGNDLMVGGGSLSTFSGGDGNDTVQAGSAAQSYLRGDSGDDSISGGAGFDDANGNMGNDTIHGNGGDDYSVGGKDNDLLFGDAGNDIVWGNLGNDTCDGGDGNDQVRGGQGDDSVAGGAGDDFISGDRGNDTETGGAGADIFHTSQDAGVDKVLDFHLSEGDRVQLDPGTTYTVSQVGADTVIDMGAGNEMILVGVQMSTLTPGWIFGA